MGNFLRKGKRKSEEVTRRKTKKHLNEFYKILHELDDVAKEMILHEEEVTTDNIEEIASNYTDREIGKYEKMILLSKMQSLKPEEDGKVENNN